MAAPAGAGCHWTTGFNSAPTSTGLHRLSSKPAASQPRQACACAGVVHLAHQEVGLEDRAGRGSPRWAGDDVGRGAVGELEVEQGAEPRLLAVMIALLAEADVAAVPAVGQDRAQGVVAGADLIGDVEGSLVDSLGVVGPAGVEIIVADAPAVQVDVEDAQRGGVQGGALDGLVDLERRAKIRRRRQDQLGELELAPGGHAVVAEHLGGWPILGVERPVVPVGAGVVAGFPRAIAHQGDRLAVGRRDDQLGEETGRARPRCCLPPRGSYSPRPA